jgi:polysaccharide chain length determinant protein (PEP-CTERM system associated)
MLGHRPLDTEDYLSILKRRWWVLAVPVLIFPILAFGVSFFVSPQYLSQTLVIIESQKVPDNYVKPVISSDLDSRLASMKEQILSRSRLQPIIERYKLYADGNLSMDDRINSARKNIDIKPITSEMTHAGGLPGFFISFKAREPHTAQLVCGEITSLFLGENLRSREASAEGTTDFLASQLADAKRNLDEQDAKLAAFQNQYMGRLPGEETPNLDMLTSLNTQLESANQSLARMEQDKAYEEAMLSQQSQSSSTAHGGASLGGGSSQSQEADLQRLTAQEADLSAHYTADYPDVIAIRRKIADLRKQIDKAPAPSSSAVSTEPSRYDSPAVQQLRAQVRAADIGIKEKKAEQAKIQSGISMYQGRIQSSPIVEEQYKAITRDNQTAQAFYDDLLGKMNQSKMATDLEKREEGEQFRVMDEPNLPDSPVFPKRGMFLAGGFVAGFAFGLIIIAVIEYKDKTLRTEKDVWFFTKLHTLGQISEIDSFPSAEESRLGLWGRMFNRRPQAQGQA